MRSLGELGSEISTIAVPPVLVGVADRVRAGLRQRELQVGDDLRLESPGARDAREREPAERDVLGARRDGEGDDAVAVLAGVAIHGRRSVVPGLKLSLNLPQSAESSLPDPA